MTDAQSSLEFFTAGGTLPPNAPSYVKRPADDELFRYIMAGEFCYVLTPRQMGKSSLMIRTAQRLSNEGVKSAIVDLTQTGTGGSEDDWYKGILAQIKRRIKSDIDPVDWWEKRRGVPNIQKFIEFFEETLIEIKERVVIFIDEIDTTLKLEFRDNFFAGIRAIYNARAENLDLKRVTFVLLGVASPSDLIKDRNRTPFNIGHEIPLRPFSREDAQPLEGGLNEIYPEFGKTILDRIFYWTNGHPYLTQKLCQSVVENRSKKIDNQEIDLFVNSLFTAGKASRETNLQFVRDILLSYPQKRELLKLYQELLAKTSGIHEDNNSILQRQLRLSGVAIVDDGKLVLSNQIYGQVFDLKWARKNTPKNWPKVIRAFLTVIVVILLALLGYNYNIIRLSEKYVKEFYTNPDSSKRLEYLARLFDLHGFLPNIDYDFLARESFYSLNWYDQTRLFNSINITPQDNEKYLTPVVDGLYVTMANVRDEQGSSDLLKLMHTSLKEVKTAESVNLQREIKLWLEARNSLSDQVALEKYNEVINLNQSNPATHYERALIAIRLGQHDQALADLDTTMGLAQNISSETSEKEIATPTQRETEITVTETDISMETPPPTLGDIPQLPTQTSFVEISTPVQVEGVPQGTATSIIESTSIPSSESPREGYRSSFYSIAYIRSAIDLVLKDNRKKPDFENALHENLSKLNNLVNAGLINPSGLAIAATTAAAETQYFGTGTSLARNEIDGQALSNYYATGTALAIPVSPAPTITQNPLNQTRPPASQTVTITLTTTPTPTPVVVITTSNCRSQTTEFSERIVQIPQGEAVEIIGRNERSDWLKIKWGEYECWILTELVDVVVNPTAVPTILTPIIIPTPTKKGGISGERVIFLSPASGEQVVCPSGDTCAVSVNIDWVNPTPGNSLCVYVRPGIAGQPYYLQFSGTSGAAYIGPADDNTSFSINAVSTSGGCGGSNLPKGTASGGVSVIRINN